MSESPFPAGETEPNDNPVNAVVAAAQAAVAALRGLPEGTVVEFASVTPEEYEVAQAAATAVLSGTSE